MATPDNLGEILERLKNNTLTDADLEILAQIVGHTTLQTVEQSGKYNANLAQASSPQLGDRYGYGPEELLVILRELQFSQPNNTSKIEQAQQEPENEPLTALTIESQVVERINSCMTAIETLHNVGRLANTQFPDNQKIEFNRLKKEIHSLKAITQKLLEIVNAADRLHKEAEKILVEQTLLVNQQKAKQSVASQQNLPEVREFQAQLEEGKVVANWLVQQRQSERFTQSLVQYTLDSHPRIRETLSPGRRDAFHFSFEQFLERLSHCLNWGRSNSLDQPVTSVVLDDEAYVTAFEKLKTLIPDHLPDDGIEQLQEYIDYLIKSLPNYRHISMD
jgi:Effector-associated domain 10